MGIARVDSPTQTVNGVVTLVMAAASSLLGGDSTGESPTGESPSGSAPSAAGTAVPTVAAPSGDGRTVGVASGSGATEVRAAGLTGFPLLPGSLSGLRSQSSLTLQDLPPLVSIPSDFEAPVVAGDIATSGLPAKGSATAATALPGFVADVPSWLVATGGGILLLVGATGVGYGASRLRRRTTAPPSPDAVLGTAPACRASFTEGVR